MGRRWSQDPGMNTKRQRTGLRALTQYSVMQTGSVPKTSNPPWLRQAPGWLNVILTELLAGHFDGVLRFTSPTQTL